jgi:predicted nucleic acid-binding protein
MRLLDSDVMIDLERQYPPALMWFDSLTEAPGLPGFVVLEMLEGCRNKAEIARVQAQAALFAVYWPTRSDSERAMSTFARARLSHRLSIPDLMIAECAVGLGATLCTFNVRHFRIVTGLVTEQPYLRS